jgi:hypothetical protein
MLPRKSKAVKLLLFALQGNKIISFLERWLSGRRHVPAKDAYLLKQVPRVQIPLFPHFFPSPEFLRAFT